TVNFHPNLPEGTTSITLMPSLVLKYGVEGDLPENKYNYDNHHFIGWAYDSSSTIPYLDNQQKIKFVADSKDPDFIELWKKTISGYVDLYAVWNDNPAVIFDTNGGAFSDGETHKIQIITPTDEIDIPDDPGTPGRAGYEFTGWYEKNEDGTLKSDEYTFTEDVTESITLFAGWIPMCEHDGCVCGDNCEGEDCKCDESGEGPGIPPKSAPSTPSVTSLSPPCTLSPSRKTAVTPSGISPVHSVPQ
ncbi:MAG: InlB B-repeat-containing protein, partial [Clostridia bacterium]|nr:InlB B-repeat-containing protein [Clostridia bacterium]